MTNEQPSATQPSQTAGREARAISRQPTPQRKCPPPYACFGIRAGYCPPFRFRLLGVDERPIQPFSRSCITGHWL